MSVKILHGHCVDLMAAMEPQSVHCSVSSPPYWGLRDYGTDPVDWPAITYSPMPGLPACVEIPAMTASLGLEPTLEAFIGHMVHVYRGVRRVLRDDGTCWVNMGDSYAGSMRGSYKSDKAWDDSQVRNKESGYSPGVRARTPYSKPTQAAGLKPKDLIGQPWRLAFALQADGWWLRQDVIWKKPNPMPESTRDRCTKAHEYLFLLAKSERYYWNKAAMMEECGEDTHARYASANGRPFGVSNWEGRPRFEESVNIGQSPPGRKSRKLAEAGSGTKNNTSFDAAMAIMPTTRNKRSVWEVATEAFSEAHFATFPRALIKPCIEASCPEGGTVLDQFGGSGTTGLVADQLQRNAVLCELNASYIALQDGRIRGDSPLFADLDVTLQPEA